MAVTPRLDDEAKTVRTEGSSGAPSRQWLERVYEEWRLPMLRYIHRLTGDPHLAEDAAHEAFLRLMSASAATTSAMRSPGAWLFHVAANIARDAGRRDTTRHRASIHLVNDARPVDRPDELCERGETARAVRVALEALGERDRAVLLMREAGLSYDEIGESIGIQSQSVPSVVMRALRRFRAAYEKGE